VYRSLSLISHVLLITHVPSHAFIHSAIHSCILNGQVCVCVCVCVGGEIQINLQLDVCCELFLFFYRLHYFVLIQSDFISSFVSGFI